MCFVLGEYIHFHHRSGARAFALISSEDELASSPTIARVCRGFKSNGDKPARRSILKSVKSRPARLGDQLINAISARALADFAASDSNITSYNTPAIRVERKQIFHRRKDMGIVSWIVLGLIAGFIGSKIVDKQGQGFWLNIALGIVGALVGGFLFDLFGAAGVTGLNLYSMLVAIAGSIVVLLIYNALTGHRSRA